MEEKDRPLTVAELQLIMAKQQQALAERIIAADQEIAARKALHEAEMSKERLAIEEFHLTKAVEREAKRLEENRIAVEKAKAEMAAALKQEQEDNARAEEEKRIRKHLELLQQRASEIEILEERLRKVLSEKINNPSVELPQDEPSPERMSSHLKRLLHMGDRDTVGLERPEQYEKTL